MIGVSTVAFDCIDGDVSCMWWDDVAVVLQVAAASAIATSYAEVQVVVLIVCLCVLFFIYSLLPSHRMNRWYITWYLFVQFNIN